jgi:hypothetical protein
MQGIYTYIPEAMSLGNTVLQLFCYYYYYYISCHRHFLPGNSLEPTVITTAQASSFTLHYYYYYYYYYYWWSGVASFLWQLGYGWANVKTGPPFSCLFCTVVIFRALSGLDAKLTVKLHIVPRLRMRGALPLLPQYVFIACTGKALPIIIIIIVIIIVIIIFCNYVCIQYICSELRSFGLLLS